jgi:hypothetical protein
MVLFSMEDGKEGDLPITKHKMIVLLSNLNQPSVTDHTNGSPLHFHL